MRKQALRFHSRFSNPRNDKAPNNQGFVVHKMAEAMGFEHMDLLQSTVFKAGDLENRLFDDYSNPEKL